jgi:hypothetical protein
VTMRHDLIEQTLEGRQRQNHVVQRKSQPPRASASGLCRPAPTISSKGTPREPRRKNWHRSRPCRD